MKYTLITGASSGIGLSLAKLFAANRSPLILCARRLDRLQQTANELKEKNSVDVEVVACDLARPTGPSDLFNAVKTKKWEVETLVNNAGFGLGGDFADLGLDRQLEMIQVNITSLTELSHLFVQEMKQRKSGKIMNLASTAAFQAGPHMAIYFATKAYVLHFSEALATELKTFGVTVTAVCPGATLTEFSEVANIAGSKLFKSRAMDVDMVAKIAYDGLQRGKRLVIPGFANMAMTFSGRFAPRALTTYLSGKMMSH